MPEEVKKVEVAPDAREALLKAIENDDNLSEVFADLQGERTEEDVGETVKEETVDKDGEAAETEVVQQTDSEAQDGDKEKPVVNEKFKQFYKEDGTLDSDKLLKSYEHAQQLIGKTAAERAELNRAKEAQAQFEQFRGLVESDKELAAAVGRAIQRKQLGVPAAIEQQPVTSEEDLNKLVEEAYAKGDFRGAHKLLTQHDPTIKALEERAMRAERALQEQQSREQKKYQDAELQTFASHHIEDGLFDEKGQAKDVELFNAMVGIYQQGKEYASLPYEDVYHIARSRLGRIATSNVVQNKTQPQTNPDKTRAIAASRVQSRAVTREPVVNTEAIPGFGVSMNDLEAYFKGSR